MPPLVSVMLICRNSAHTLPWCLASLLAQTYKNWECIFVDDGSTDGSSEMARTIADPRIQTLRLDTGRGRGAARQRALEAASGEFLAILDADDWMYPWKLSRQVALLQQFPSAALVSSRMAIVDERNDIVGVRNGGSATSTALQQALEFELPSVPFPACMLRAELSRQIGFDPTFLSAEDTDFLVALLLNHQYCCSSEIAYVYSEYTSVSLDKLLVANHFVRRLLRKHYARFPFAARLRTTAHMGKAGLYRLVFLSHQSHRLLRRRSQEPTKENVSEYHRAREIVAQAVQERWG